MLTKVELVGKLRHLIEEYQRYNKEEKEAMSEDDTRAKFIDPLLKDVLGWDEREIDRQTSMPSLTPEGHMKRADYSYPKIPKLIVEAKKLKIPIDDGEYDNQVIDYSYSKAINWAILTNFKSFRVWYVTRNKKIMFCRLNLVDDNINQVVDELFLFAKENIFNGELNKKAEMRGIKLQDINITIDLAQSLNVSREKINNYIKDKYNGRYEDDREEMTQGIINRLIFIKKVEAEGLEENKLEQVIRKERTNMYDKVITIFSYYRQNYDSDIFGKPEVKAEVEKLELNDSFTLELLKAISSPIGSERGYNFAAMDVDVLGSIYENYLAYMQKGIKLVGGEAERKATGIYYTPKNIVDFIVNNTVKNKFNTIRLAKAKSIKIVDPSCGSGSFLVNSLEKLEEYYKKSHRGYADLSVNDKLKLLKNNIYGVDVDERAVAIAKLNIYLQILTQNGQKTIRLHHTLLPELKSNIKNGDSLVEDKTIDASKAFMWGSEFSEIAENGWFDIIIGNPPWVSIKGKHKSIEMTEKKLNYLINKYGSDTYMPNLYEMFIWRAMSLLKNGGLFSFIVPDRLCTNQQFIKLRKFILANFSIKKLWFRVPFPDVIADTVVFVLEKRKDTNNIIEIAEYPDTNFVKIPQRLFTENEDANFFFIKKEIYEIFDSIKSNKNMKQLSEVCLTTSGCGAKSDKVTEIKENDKQIPIIKGESIQKYQLVKHFWFDFSPKNLSGRTRDVNKLGKKLKVLLRKTGADLIASFDDSGIYPEQSLYFLYTKDDDNSDLLIILLAILNSDLMNCYYKNFAITNRDSTPQLKNVDLDRFPIILPKDSNKILEISKNLLNLRKAVLAFGDKRNNAREKLEAEVDELYKKLNKEVYALYGLNNNEQKIIEDSLSSNPR